MDSGFFSRRMHLGVYDSYMCFETKLGIITCSLGVDVEWKIKRGAVEMFCFIHFM